MAVNDLFENTQETRSQPLAARMRPRTLDEFIGQEHIVGPGRLLRRAIAADQLGSLILSGPPGTGKTTLAQVIAGTTRSAFISLNAVLGGVKDVRDAVSKARDHRDLHGRKTILFVDEVHRWNKAQQDALLPWVENGTIVLIGATTENPFFEVNAALVSRSRIFRLTPLQPEHLRQIAEMALRDPNRGYGALKVAVDDDALDHLIRIADGDARTLLNALQLAVETGTDAANPENNGEIHVTLGVAEDSIQAKALLYDKEGDYHYDSISAFIKSLRGSDPDAALYWTARMLLAGEDPKYLFRRMLVFASEDVGLADSHALTLVESAASAFERVGMPEGQFHLSHAVLYLATAPKSNSTLGYYDAVKAVERERQADVPKHLRDGSRDMHGFGHGEGYLYPH
ncbi:MAG: AAA family ATPase, partial [bacterium]